MIDVYSRNVIQKMQKSNMKYKLVCLVYDDEEYITFGYNYNVPLKNGKNKYSIHAEEMAIHRLKHSLKYDPNRIYTFIILRMNKSGTEYKASMPCPKCIDMLSGYIIIYVDRCGEFVWRMIK